MADDETQGKVIERKKVPAGPVKRFFIDILTRDIELVAAILDLVDNSVDSAMELHPDGDFSGLRIDIEASKDGFSIKDNCGGITLEAAETYVFRMGRPEDTKGLESSIGQFGVGMKRALFKIGTKFRIESSTGESFFTVDLDVDDWEDDPEDWSLQLEVHAPGADGYPPRGTRIFVDKLQDGVVEALGDMVERNQLKEELRSTHRMAIERGLTITLNNEELGKTPTYLSAAAVQADLYPLIQRFTVLDEDGRLVDVAIFVGIYDETTMAEDAEPEDVPKGDDDAGWYVFGNDRLLLSADKSAVTGWGSGSGNMPLYHNQFSRFRGYVYMRAKDSVALPWNTTKTGVEGSDRVWTKVRGEMINAGRQVITALNSLKLERRALASGETGIQVPITDTLKNSAPVSTASLVSAPPRKFTYVTPNAALTEKRDSRKITYSTTNAEFDQVAEVLGVSKPVQVGRGTFDYFLDREVNS